MAKAAENSEILTHSQKRKHTTITFTQMNL